jgi:hypothetical protein
VKASARSVPAHLDLDVDLDDAPQARSQQQAQFTGTHARESFTTASRRRGAVPICRQKSADLHRRQHKCFLVKLHGDYKDARIRNIDEELGV